MNIGNKMIFPRPFAFAIDDLGWNIGNDSGDVDGVGPYRIGLDRKMDIQNYQSIVAVCKTVGVRVQGLFVLSEMDRENILAKFPTTTWQGAEWDNSKNVSQEQIDIMEFVLENAAHLEFGFHGLGHEYWFDGVLKRAEWYNKVDNYPWPEEIMRDHIQCFKDIMAQYGLSKQNGHSFPESFVPCSYAYYWNPNGKYSTGKLMSEAGVKYVNTLFDEISELNPPQGNNGGGFDNGVVVVNRITYGNEWFELSKVPTVDIESQESDMIESHWTNWLAQDDFMQPATNQQWINYYKMVQANPNRYVAKNTEQFHSQWLYNKYTTVTETTSGKVTIDNTNMPAEPYTYKLLGNMVLKIKLEPNQHISHALIDGKPVCSYFEDQGFGFIYLPMLTQKIYNLEYKIGDQNLTSFIFNKGTYNVYNFEPGKKQAQAEIRLYGTAEMDIYGVPNPKNIKLSNHQIMLVNSQYNESEKHLTLTIKAHNIQGETGIITFEY
jgi:hypothetical protein